MYGDVHVRKHGSNTDVFIEQHDGSVFGVYTEDSAHPSGTTELSNFPLGTKLIWCRSKKRRKALL